MGALGRRSPNSNKGQDEYGGDWADRAEILRRAIAAIRGRVGWEPIISCRINGAESIPNGLNLQEGAQFGKMVEDADIDVLHASGVRGRCRSVRKESRLPASLPPS